MVKVEGASVTRQTLEETPGKALKLLRAIGTKVQLQSALSACGYDDADHAEGWRLLHAVSGFVPAGTLDETNPGVRNAIAELDAWDEDGFRIARAALKARFPKQAEALLGNLEASTGPGAVLGVSAFLDRLDVLADSDDPDDQAAVELLEKRGIGVSERKRLRGLLTQVEELEPPRAIVAPDDGTYVENLVKLRSWYEEWSEIARVKVKRRDLLILMGLAQRKARRSADGTPEAGSPV
ncbi:MAG: hypothetical protein HYV07_21470 [Deltaproteobacteria bacterium]|nr:hypothetical protein [Deltaproteobacteria bacterium]